MKTLLLLRHARPTPNSPTGRDFDRPLAAAGRADALLVGEFLRRSQLTPASVVCSPAARARQTAEHVLDAAQLATPLLFHERIYEASVEQLIEVVAESAAAAGDAAVLLVVGHNPGLQELVERLTGAGASMHPATLARVDLDIDAWDDLLRDARGVGQLVYALPPQALAGQ